MTQLLEPCQHHTAEEYTAIVADTTQAVLNTIRENLAEQDGGMCTTVIEEVFEQVLIYNVKQMARDVGKLETAASMGVFLNRLTYHVFHALARTEDGTLPPDNECEPILKAMTEGIIDDDGR